jgi:hypothetical protein
VLDTDDLALWYAINRLIANYWAEVDDNGGSQAHEFYEPEAVYTVGANRFEGADKIRAFYTRRRQYGNITTRAPSTWRALPRLRRQARASSRVG